MSFVVTAPPVLASAASDLGGIASMISEANAMAAVRTTALAPAAADEVSAAIAALFSSYARDYQTLSVQVTAFHVQFAQTLTNAGQLYAVVDVGNGVLLKTEQQVLGVINAPTQTLVGRPLIGDGTHGAPGTGQNGGAGGILWADPFPLVDVRQDLALGKGAHRFSQLLALRCGPDVHNRVSGISTWRLRSHSPSPLACGSKRAW